MVLNTSWSQCIPYSINDTYGDPFIKQQIQNTKNKILESSSLRSPIAIFTKAPFDKDVLDSLKEAKENKMVVPFYSLTGLDEGGFSFENRIRMIEGIEDALERPVVFLMRPIIRGKNDSKEALSKIVNACKERSRILVLGGLHDQHKMKKIESNVEEQLIEMCNEADIKYFHKSSCCGSYLHGQKCWLHHHERTPQNLQIVKQLGYEFQVEENKCILNWASTGDLNFLRILTRSEVYAKKIISNYNLLSISKPQIKLECTSSWFAWSKNIDTCIGCNYCIILQIEYLEKKEIQIGISPLDLETFTSQQNISLFTDFHRTKLKKKQDLYTGYANVRTVKPCCNDRHTNSVYQDEFAISAASGQ